MADWQVEAWRQAQIQMGQLAEVALQLLQQTQVQAKMAAPLQQGFGTGAAGLTGQHIHGVTGDQPQQQKIQQQDADYGGDGLPQGAP